MIFIKEFPTPTDIKRIDVTYPLAIISDTHTSIKDIRKLKETYNNIICLGDITSIYDKDGEFCVHSLNYFQSSKIPCLYGNHEEVVFTHPALSQENRDFIKSLPIGFRLNLPNGRHYNCYHNTPTDVWTHFNPLPPSSDLFEDIYPTDKQTEGIIIGHQHVSLTHNYGKIKLVCVGLFYKEGNYVVLDENGIRHEKI